MAEKKHSELYILKILKEYTDENHLLSRKEIQEILKEEYGIEIDRRTFYSALDVLDRMGVDIATFGENRRGYYLLERQFEFSEVLLLCNAIHASSYIPRKASSDMVDKLLATQSKYRIQAYHDEIYLPNPKKTENKELLFSIEVISSAIRNHHGIQFVYCSYNIHKKLEERHHGKVYVMNPQYIVYQDSKPYLIAKDPDTDQYRHFRLDRIRKIKEDSRETEKISRNDPYTYASNRLFMYSGEKIEFTAKCSMKILDYMIDLFGKNIGIHKEDDEYFILHATSTKQDIIWLSQEYLDAMEILEPAEIRSEIVNNLKESLAKYQ